MRAQHIDDMVTVVGTGIPGLDVPPGLQNIPQNRLRVYNGTVVDADTYTTFFIDDRGRKHISAGTGRQQLACRFGDTLVRAGDGTWSVEGAAVALKRYLADKRWRVETAGTTLDLGGGVIMEVPTDRDGRAALKQARDMLRDGELLDEEGNVLTAMAVVIGEFAAPLTEPQATAILKRAGQHVQMAFDVQAAAIAQIAAGTITTTAEIDALDWPS